MGTRLATASRNAAVDAVALLFDAGAGVGTIKIYSGTQPSTPNDTATGTLLATVNLADPSTGSSTNGVRTLLSVPLSGTGVATGTAGWARWADSTGAAVMDGVVTATGGGGQIELSTTSISTGVTVQITSGTITQPLGS